MQLTVVGGELLDFMSTNDIGRKFADELVVTALNLKGKVCVLTCHKKKLISDEGNWIQQGKGNHVPACFPSIVLCVLHVSKLSSLVPQSILMT